MKRILRSVVVFFSLFVLLEVLPSTASAGTLIGHIRYLAMDMPIISGTVHVYNGLQYCGSATLSAVGGGGLSAGEVAFETFRSVMLEPNPKQAAHQVVITTSGPVGICLQTTEPATSFYLEY